MEGLGNHIRCKTYWKYLAKGKQLKENLKSVQMGEGLPFGRKTRLTSYCSVGASPWTIGWNW